MVELWNLLDKPFATDLPNAFQISHFVWNTVYIIRPINHNNNNPKTKIINWDILIHYLNTIGDLTSVEYNIFSNPQNSLNGGNMCEYKFKINNDTHFILMINYCVPHTDFLIYLSNCTKIKTLIVKTCHYYIDGIHVKLWFNIIHNSNPLYINIFPTKQKSQFSCT